MNLAYEVYVEGKVTADDVFGFETSPWLWKSHRELLFSADC